MLTSQKTEDNTEDGEGHEELSNNYLQEVEYSLKNN